MLQNSRAIVLRTIKHSDSTLIADVYTETDGRRSFLVRIPKTSRAGVKNVLFTPMAQLQIEWNDRGTTQLMRVKAVHPANIYSTIPYSPAKTAIVMFLAEFLSAALRTPIGDAALFEFLFASMRWLDEGGENCANFHIVFLLHLTSYLGFTPNLENYSPGQWFDMDNGRFSPVRPSTPNVIAPQEAQNISWLLRLKYATAAKLPISRAMRSRILQVIIQYYSVHLPAFPTLKSPEILHEIFG